MKDSNLSGDNINTEIVTEQLKIKQNIFEYGKSFFQISNVSFVTVDKPIYKVNMYALLAAIVGVILLLFTREGKMVGFFIAAVGIAILAYQRYQFLNAGDNLAIQLNSGLTLKFNCKDPSFLNKVLVVIKECINGNRSNTNSMIIDFSRSKIYGTINNTQNNRGDDDGDK